LPSSIYAMHPLDNNSKFPEYFLLSNASSFSWRERTVRSKPMLVKGKGRMSGKDRMVFDYREL
jgi:hypothetical protein